MNVTREKQADVKAIHTARLSFYLHTGQTFYTTPKAYEIWNEEPLQMVKRIPRKSVYWVSMNDGSKGAMK